MHGAPIIGLLGVLFVALKLTGYITWSWWWVTAPFWGGAAFIVACLLFAFVFVSLVSLVASAFR